MEGSVQIVDGYVRDDEDDDDSDIDDEDEVEGNEGGTNGACFHAVAQYINVEEKNYEVKYFCDFSIFMLAKINNLRDTDRNSF